MDSQTRAWNKVAQTDRIFYNSKEGYKNLKNQLSESNIQIAKTKQGRSLMNNKNVSQRLL